MDKMESKSWRIFRIVKKRYLLILLIFVSCNVNTKKVNNSVIEEPIRIDWIYPGSNKDFSTFYMLKGSKVDSLNFRFTYMSKDSLAYFDYELCLNCKYSKLYLKHDTIDIHLNWFKTYTINGRDFKVYNFELFEFIDDGLINAFWSPDFGIIHYYNKTQRIKGEINFMKNCLYQKQVDILYDKVIKDTLFYIYNGLLPPSSL